MKKIEKMKPDKKQSTNRIEAGAHEFTEFFGKKAPKYAIILGSGLSKAFKPFYGAEAIMADFKNFSHLPQLTVEGHQGKIVLTKFGKKKVIIIAGRKHFYENANYDEVTRLICILLVWGVRTFFITNAAGAIDSQYSVGDIVFINDHDPSQIANLIDAPIDSRERFTSMENAYNQRLTHSAHKHGNDLLQGTKISCWTSGRYLAVKGPDFETPMQIQHYKQLGASLVGMSTIPEIVACLRKSKALRIKSTRLVGVSIVSNMAAGIANEMIEHKSVVKIVSRTAPYLAKILHKTIVED